MYTESATINQAPVPPVPEPAESPIYFGGRVLIWILQNHGLVGPLDDHALRCADRAAILAMAPKECAIKAIERVNAIRHYIGMELGTRAAQAQAALVNADQGADQPPSSGGGRKVLASVPEPVKPSPSAMELAPVGSTVADEL